MNKNEEYIEQLILKKLSNEASPVQLTELERWLDASPANREEYESLRHVWDSSWTALRQPAFDGASAWRKMGLSPGIGAIKPVLPQGRPVRQWRVLLSAAALLFLLSLGAWLLFRGSGASGMKTLVAVHGDERATLPDGSLVWLREGSTISYPVSFAHGRSLELKGEAYFEVTGDAARTFLIRTSRALIEVLGTRFLVRQVAAMDKLLVTDGRVKFSDRESTGRQLVLAAGESATLSDSGITKDRRCFCSIAGRGLPAC